MRISQKGLYALQALTILTRRHAEGSIRIREIAAEAKAPEKFLEIILLELKNARFVESTRGNKGGYRLRRAPDQIRLGEVIRLIDGPLAPFGDAEQLRRLIALNDRNRPLYELFLELRDAASNILDNKTLADLQTPSPPGQNDSDGSNHHRGSA